MKDGRVNLKCIARTFVNVTMCPQQNYNIIFKKKLEKNFVCDHFVTGLLFWNELYGKPLAFVY
jgi:hypothetical protein